MTKSLNTGLQHREKNYIRGYVITTYLIFWDAIMLVGVLFLLCGQNKSVMNWGTIGASWVPTIVLMCSFHGVVSEEKRSDWIKNAFKPRLKIGILLFVTVCLVAAVFGTYVIAVQSNNELSFHDLKGITIQSLIPIIFFNPIHKDCGEEAGWRGFLQQYFEKSTTVRLFKSALVVGVIWSFWHTPLWFITGSSCTNVDIYRHFHYRDHLSVIIAVCYVYCRNLIVPMCDAFSLMFVLLSDRLLGMWRVFLWRVVGLQVSILLLPLFLPSGTQ